MLRWDMIPSSLVPVIAEVSSGRAWTIRVLVPETSGVQELLDILAMQLIATFRLGRLCSTVLFA